MMLQQDGRLKIREDVDVPRVRAFLQSKARNSIHTAEAYEQALSRFRWFLQKAYPTHNLETIVDATLRKTVDVYRLLDDFIQFLLNLPRDLIVKYKLRRKPAVAKIHQFVEGVKSYLSYHDIDIIPQKFKNKVTLPKNRKEDERPLDKEEVRKILLAITNRRLRAYCGILACAGPRAVEALAIRYKDIDFSVNPTKVYMRAEYSKNRLPREIYLSNESTEFLKRWVEWKKSNRSRATTPDDLVFAVMAFSTPDGMYQNVSEEFQRVVKTAGLSEREDGQFRHAITLHSFRRYVKTVVEDNTAHSFSEYILGHKKSVYYTKKEPERRRLWDEKCHRYLTYLDYSGVESLGKSIEKKLEEKDVDIRSMREEIHKLYGILYQQGIIKPEQKEE